MTKKNDIELLISQLWLMAAFLYKGFASFIMIIFSAVWLYAWCVAVEEQEK